MRLYDEIFKRADGSFDLLPKCLIVPNGNGYFQGVKTMGEFSDTRIEIYFQGLHPLRAEVIGRALTVLKYCDGDLEIGGKITSFGVLENGTSC
ncbi:MAG: hypothetical protein IJ317_01740 [Clostridia bacterium]|nr:hypothetical protein [Clostridia bacterium]